MEFDHNNVRQAVDEDRLSSLPDGVIEKILSSLDMKFGVQTCVLSSRWKLLWTSTTCLNFSSGQFGTLPKFSEFVTHVLSHRNLQVEVFSVKLDFDGEVDEVIVGNIATYAFSRNVQQLEIFRSFNDDILDSIGNEILDLPRFPFSSQSLKHFTLNVPSPSSSISLDTPFDFPALTTMHLNNIIWSGDIALCADLFSKCVNLKNLTLDNFFQEDMGVLDINTPRLSNLILIDPGYLERINVVAPQLENLTAIKCSTMVYLNAPSGLVSLCYTGFYLPVLLSKDGFHSLNKVTLCLFPSTFHKTKENAREIIKLLKEVQSARYLTLGANIIECLSKFPKLLSHHPSPFSNLISLTVDYSNSKAAYKVKMSSEAINFLLENSPRAKLNLELPKDRNTSLWWS